MKNFVKRMSLLLFVVFTFLSNLIPILGPGITSNAIGYNERRFKKLYGINRKSSIISILLGSLLFSLILWVLISYSVEFKSSFRLWLIFATFLLNCIFSIIFYFIGKNRSDQSLSK